jgi:dipeptidyl aminopeptidase/acylaminoacyl peptidase
VRAAALTLLALSLAGSAPGAQAPPDPTLAFTRSTPGGAGVYLLGGGRLRLLARDAREASWSPDGRRVAYVAPGAGGAADLFVADADGTHRGRITWTPGVDETSPSWDRDGRRVVVERGGDIVTLRADGSSGRVLAAGLAPAWSPSGRQIAYSDGDDLFVASSRGGSIRRLAKALGFQSDPAWSPDGRRLAYVSDEALTPDVYVMNVRTGRSTRLTMDDAAESSPAFSANGRDVLFTSERAGVETLWRVRAAGGAAAPLPAAQLGSEPAVRPLRRAFDLPPDLEQRPPADLSVKTVTRGGRRRFLLGFDSATDNIGLGPVIIAARRPSRRVPFMGASQIIRLTGGRRQTIPNIGVLRYVYAASHAHWHVMGFQRYELRRAEDNAVVLRDRKSGFCLADHYAHAPGHFTNEPRGPVFKGYCERGRPQALAVYQGTSVGYTDRYPSHFHGQNLNVTRIPAGTYVLVHRANRSLLFRELRYENNAASLRIQLSWPHGRSSPPAVRILKTCPDSARC